MRKTKWMVLCLFIGFLMAAGMMSTVPVYTDASLRRTLTKEMEQYQLDKGEFPGIYTVERDFAESVSLRERMNAIDSLTATVKERADYLPVPAAASKTVIVDNMQFIYTGGVRGTTSTRARLTAMTGLDGHISLTAGRMPSGEIIDGTLEVIVTEPALKIFGVTLDGVYRLAGADAYSDPLSVKIVGVFEQSDDNDVYWSEKLSAYSSALVADYGLFCGSLADGGYAKPTSVAVRYALDVGAMDLNDLAFAVRAIGEDAEYYPTLGCKFTMGALGIWKNYAAEAEKLTGILWSLQIPTMVMLAFYLFMVSKLHVEQEKNEIAVLRSRGAGAWQVFGMYALETGILCLAAYILAPFIGLAMCRFIGVSDGFLEFVNRTGISARITPGRASERTSGRRDILCGDDDTDNTRFKAIYRAV